MANAVMHVDVQHARLDGLDKEPVCAVEARVFRRKQRGKCKAALWKDPSKLIKQHRECVNWCICARAIACIEQIQLGLEILKPLLEQILKTTCTFGK